MSDPEVRKLSQLRAAFDSRLAQLPVDGFAEHEIERLWRTYCQQQSISARYDAQLDPAADGALELRVESESLQS